MARLQTCSGHSIAYAQPVMGMEASDNLGQVNLGWQCSLVKRQTRLGKMQGSGIQREFDIFKMKRKKMEGVGSFKAD